MTDETKYTPGPWSVRSTGFGEYQISAPASDGGDDWSVGMAFGAAGFHEIDGEVESRANAHLIAAAPDLLKCLKELREELRLIRMKDTGAVYDVTCRILADAAIEKAEGRSK